MQNLISSSLVVSTHSRPKAAADFKASQKRKRSKFQHTAARRRLRRAGVFSRANFWFQHTAARRRLLLRPMKPQMDPLVSTHSRPKAAAYAQTAGGQAVHRFNTQPPEGGCSSSGSCNSLSRVSTHSRPKAAAKAYHLP